MTIVEKIVVAIPSYDRPEMLESTLRRLLLFESVEKIVVEADASEEEKLWAYKRILMKNPKKIVSELNVGRRGSTNARNALLKLVAKNVGEVEYVLLLDDDCLLPHNRVIQIMVDDLRMQDDVGIVGGRWVSLERRNIDPEFFLGGVPKKVARCLTRVSGWVFGSSSKEVYEGKETTAFMMIRMNALRKVFYDENYQGTGFREETDLQRQILQLGFKILTDDRAYVYHLPVEEGGNRNQTEWSRRIYWKARNHTYFVLKWHGHRSFKNIWYMLAGTAILTFYRPSCLHKILSGLRHGYELWNSARKA